MEGIPVNENLKAFRELIATLKEQEEENGKTAHLTECNPDELGEEDKRIYYKYILKDLTRKVFEEYQNKLMVSGNKSQQKFSAYIANMVGVW